MKKENLIEKTLGDLTLSTTENPSLFSLPFPYSL